MLTLATMFTLVGVALAAPAPVVDCPAPAKWTVSATNTLVCSGTTTTPPPECTTDCNPPPECTTDCTPPPSGGDVCTSSDAKSANVWGNPTVYSWDVAPFVHQTIAFQIKVPSNATGNSLRTSSWVEYTTGKFQREAAFSKVACSFAPADALANGYGGKLTTTGNVAPSFIYKIGSPSGTATGLTPGQTYWINIRNRDQSGANNCTVPDCAMRGNVPD